MALVPATAAIAAAAGRGMPALPTAGARARRHSTTTSRVRFRAAVCRAARPTSVAGMWRQVQGCDDWEGLLEHPVLRGEVARYGELVDACYKTFDLDPSSPRYLSCKHRKERMLAEVGMPDAGYEVTAYIYAAVPEILPVGGHGRGRWIGYVAVSTDEITRTLGRRDVLVSLRGTVAPAEWMANIMFPLKPARLDPSDPRLDIQVETGFLTLYTSAGADGTSCRDQLLREVSRLLRIDSHKETSITLAGHSMGGALALLLAYDLAELGIKGAAPVTLFSFGAPRVGNAAFKERCDELGVKALRVANVKDPVTKLPGVILNESRAAALPPVSCYAYAHVGIELPLDFFSVADLIAVHDLRTYIAALLNQPPPTTKKAAMVEHEHRTSIPGAALVKKPPTTQASVSVLGKVIKFVGLRNAAAVLSLGGLLVHTLGLISTTSSFFTR